MNTPAPDLVAEGDMSLEAEQRVIIPVLAEEFTVETRMVETGGVRVHKTVQEHQETVDPALLRETVTVETVEVNRFVDGPTPTNRQEGDILIVPVLEERLLVEKRLFLKSELHIRRVQETVHAPQSVTLRSEVVTVEHYDVGVAAGDRT